MISDDQHHTVFLPRTRCGLLVLGLFIMVACFFSPHAASDAPKPSLMPMPEIVTWTHKKFRLADSFKAAIVGTANKWFYTGATRSLRRRADRRPATLSLARFARKHLSLLHAGDDRSDPKASRVDLS